MARGLLSCPQPAQWPSWECSQLPNHSLSKELPEWTTSVPPRSPLQTGSLGSVKQIPELTWELGPESMPLPLQEQKGNGGQTRLSGDEVCGVRNAISRWSVLGTNVLSRDLSASCLSLSLSLLWHWIQVSSSYYSLRLYLLQEEFLKLLKIHELCKEWSACWNQHKPEKNSNVVSTQNAHRAPVCPSDKSCRLDSRKTDHGRPQRAHKINQNSLLGSESEFLE